MSEQAFTVSTNWREARSLHIRGMGLTGLGVLVLSFEAMLVRVSGAGGWEAAFWRGAMLTIVLGAVLLVRDGRRPFRVFVEGGVAAWACAFLFGASGFCFILSLGYTKVANTVVLASCTPVFAALLSRFWLREPVPLRTWIAIAIALAGVAVVFSGSLGAGNWRGDLIALGAAVCMGTNLTILRRHRDMPRSALVWGSGIATVMLALPVAAPFTLTPVGYLSLALLGGVVIPTAQILMGVGTRYLSSPEVSLFLLVETVMGPLWVWFAVRELPPALTVAGGALIVGTLVVHGYLGLRAFRPGP